MSVKIDQICGNQHKILSICGNQHIIAFNTNEKEMMTKRELEKILKQNGWRRIREGKHEIWGKDGITVPIPRHKGDIPVGTVNNILRRAGIR